MRTMKTKIVKTRAGWRCRACGRLIRREEAASIHQFRDCSGEVMG
ncbi:MAG: hypothetical protein WC277_08105 [Bacilli bacterium]